MKKVLLAVLLLVILLGISYLKTVRGDRRSESYYEQGKEESAGQLIEYESWIDSLKLAAGEREVELADSLVSKDLAYQSRIDSLEDLLQNQKQKNKLSEDAVGDNGLDSDKTLRPKKPDSKYEKVLSYYKKRYNDLPGDLSAYEKKIALNEIRSETAQKFSLTMTQLQLIRQKYKLKY